MNDEQIIKLVNDHSKMAYTLGFVYGGLIEYVGNDNLPEIVKTPIMGLLQLLHKNCNEIFYTKEIQCDHENDGTRYAVLKRRSTDEREYEYKCLKCNKMYSKNKS